MKRIIRGIITAFVIVCIIASCILNMAAGDNKTIDVVFNKINIKVNSQPVDADNILWNGTTYIPLRAISEMLSKDVGWDLNTNTASINDKVIHADDNSISSTMDTKNKSNSSKNTNINASTVNNAAPDTKKPSKNMVISYDYGHMEGGKDGSARGILYEYRVVRDYGSACIKYLEQAGYTCINCTPPDGSMSLIDSLAYRVNKANESGSELHLCFHANCFNGNAHGAEIEVSSDDGERIAKPVLDKICSLGFTNRGIKRPSLYVTGNTKMTAILLEPFFIDNAGDVSLFDADKLGKAIAEGILGYNIKEINISKTINIVLNSVNIKVNESLVTVDNILYNGTTYVPLRAISEMLGKDVSWDGNTNTARINDKTS